LENLPTAGGRWLVRRQRGRFRPAEKSYKKVFGISALRANSHHGAEKYL
jgi:hypothetical protein